MTRKIRKQNTFFQLYLTVAQMPFANLKEEDFKSICNFNDFIKTFFIKKNHLWFWYISTKCVEYPASLSKPGSVGKWVGSPVGLILKMVKFHLLVNPFLPFLHSDFFHWDLFTVLVHQKVPVWTILKFSYLLELPERSYTAPLHAHLVRVETW